MNRPKILNARAAIALGAFAAPAVGGAGQAIASPDVCVHGPLGYAWVCADVPIYGDWNYGPRRHGNDDWRPHGHGHGHDD